MDFGESVDGSYPNAIACGQSRLRYASVSVSVLITPQSMHCSPNVEFRGFFTSISAKKLEFPIEIGMQSIQT